MATGISSLPAELIIRIIDFAHPSAHLSFARTCRFIFECSKDVLKAHGKAHDGYAICNDVLPTTIPALLREILAPNPIVAWHVRTLELYWERMYWAQWEVCPFTCEKGTRVRGQGRPLSYALTEAKLTTVLDVLRERLHFSENDITTAREDLEGGSDAPLKFVLIALCSRLTTVKYSRDYRVSGRGAFDRDSEAFPRSSRSSLDYIQRAIVSHPDNEPWHTGLSSVCTLAVGVKTGAEIDQLWPAPPLQLVLNLMKLPNLTSLYCHGLSNDTDRNYDEDDEDEDYDVAANSSSVEHIFLENSTLGNPSEFRKALKSVPKALKSLTICGGEASDMDRWFSCTPEALMFYQTEDLRGYRCNLYRPDELDTAARNLRTIVGDHKDLFLDEWYFRGNGWTHSSNKWVEPFQFFTERFENPYMRSSIETLVIQPPSTGLSEAEADQIDDAILAILAQRSLYSRHCSKCELRSRNYFPNLKAIYLASLEDEDRYGNDGHQTEEPRRRRWFRNAIRAGRNAGVDIYTRTTRARPFHQVEFPPPPNPAELRFLPDDVKDEVRNLVEFDVYSGAWGPPGCGNCGRCAGCLRRYDPAVWEEIDQASTA